MYFKQKVLVLLFTILALYRVDAQKSYDEQSIISQINLGNKYFIENRGQIVSLENKQSVPSILFKANGNSSDIFIKNNGISYVFYKITLPEMDKNDPNAPYRTDYKGEWERIDMELIGANNNPEVIKEDQGDYYENYYFAHCPNGIINNYGYKKIILKNIYPQIDWIIFFNDKGQLKYDFIVHPDGNPDDIKIKYRWADSPIKNADGTISIKGPIGEITEGKPLVIQDDKVINSYWQVDQNNVLSININEYDKNKKLTIDPILLWATYYGGSANDPGYCIKSDGTSVFVTGLTSSGNFPTQDPGSGTFFQGAFAGGGSGDAYILKFDINGVREWATYYGGAGDDIPRSLAINSNYLYVTGQTISANFPTQDIGGGAYYQATNSNAISSDAFLLMFNKNGIRQWSTYFGGSSWEAGYSVFCTETNLYFAIITSSSDMPTFDPGGGAFMQTTFGGLPNDNYILQMSSLGVPLWGTYFGGNDDEEAFNAICEYNNSIYLAGATRSTDFPVANPGGTAFFQGTQAGGKDITMSKFDLNRALTWSTYLGANGDETVRSIATSNNKIWIGGYTSNNSIPTVDMGNGAFYQGSTGGGSDGFFACFNTSDEYIWGSYYGGASIDYISSVHADNNSFWVSGRTFSSNFPVVDPGMGTFFQGTKGSGYDGFLLKFKQTGERQWSTFYGATGNEDPSYIYSDNTNVWVAGLTAANNLYTLDPGGGAYYQPAYGFGGNDAFILKFDACIKPNIAITPSSTVICMFDSTTLVASGALTYEWQMPNIFNDTLVVSPLIDSTYTVIGTDDMTCVNTANVTISVNPLPQLIITQPDSICFGDSITLHVTSNMPSYYLWSNNPPGTDSTITVTPDTLNYTFNYFVLVTDTINNCSNFASTSVYTHSLPQLSISPADSICFGDSITLLVQSDLPSYYLWSPVNGTDSILTVSPDTVNQIFTYNVLVTDSVNSCKSTASTTVYVNALPQLTITQPDSICYLDSITLVVNSDLPSYYLWTPGSGTDSTLTVSPISISDTTSYSVVVTDTVNGCKNYASTYVFVHPLPQLTISPPDSICNGDSITLQIQSDLPSFYVWSPGNGTDSTQSTYTVHPNTAYQTFTYTLVASDTMYGCKNYDTTTVYVNALPQITITQPDSICYLDSITLIVNSDLPSYYLWTPGSGTDSTLTVSPISISDTTSYSVVVTDTVNGCKNYASTYVFVHPLPQLTISPPDSICNGDSITLQIQSDLPSFYVWSPGNGTDSTQSTYTVHPNTAYQTFTYTLVASDTIYGCKNYDTTTVYVHEKPEVYISNFPISQAICFYDSITFTVNNTDSIYLNSYQWTPNLGSDSSIVFYPYQSDTIFTASVIVTSVFNCKDTATSFVIVHPDVTVNIASSDPDTAICFGNNIILTGNGNNINTYLWSPATPDSANSSINIAPDSTITYSLMVTSLENCIARDTITVTVYPLPTFEINDTTICYGNSVSVGIYNAFNSAATYTWIPGNLTGNTVTLSPSDTTTFYVTSIDSNACQYTMPITVNVDSLPIANISGISTLCYGFSTNLQASGGTSYLWLPTMETTTNIDADPLVTSTYTLIANSTICYDTASILITVNPKPIITATNDTTLIIGMSVPLFVTGAETYIWSPIDDLTCFDCDNPTAKPYSTIEYCVVGTNTYGCLDTTCVVVTIDAECGEVFVPSAFSPNGDNINDQLKVYGKCIKSMDFKVFNRWGEKVFETTDPDIGWDGTFRGKDADTDVFVYFLKAEYYIGTIVEKKGNITLMH